MANVPTFSVIPSLRCYQLDLESPFRVCGGIATVMRPMVLKDAGGFFCARHARPGDLPISPDALFRRVCLIVEIQLAGISLLRAIAHAEAVERIERAVTAAGGVLNWHSVLSTVGRASLPAAPPQGTDVGGKGL